MYWKNILENTNDFFSTFNNQSLSVSNHSDKLTKDDTEEPSLLKDRLKSFNNYSNPTPHTLAINIYGWYFYAAFIFMYFLNQPAITQQLQHIIQLKHAKVLEVRVSQFSDKRQCSRVSLKTNKLRFHCFVLDIWHTRFKMWELLFQFFHLIGFHCLGGLDFSIKTHCKRGRVRFYDWSKLSHGVPAVMRFSQYKMYGCLAGAKSGCNNKMTVSTRCSNI